MTKKKSTADERNEVAPAALEAPHKSLVTDEDFGIGDGGRQMALVQKVELPQGQHYIGHRRNDRSLDPSLNHSPTLAGMEARDRSARALYVREFERLAVLVMEVLNRPFKTVDAFLELLRQERHPGAYRIEGLEREAAELCSDLEIREHDAMLSHKLQKIGTRFLELFEGKEPMRFVNAWPELYAIFRDSETTADSLPALPEAPQPEITQGQQRLDAFLAKVNAAKPKGSRTIHESDLRAVAGYGDSTTLRDWKSGRVVSKRARQKFESVFRLSPQAFLERLAKTDRPVLLRPNLDRE